MSTHKYHISTSSKREVANSDLPTRPRIKRSIMATVVPISFGESKFNDVQEVANMVLILWLQGRQLPKDVKWPVDDYLEKHGVHAAKVKYVYLRRAYKVSFIWRGLRIGTYVMFAQTSMYEEFK